MFWRWRRSREQDLERELRSDLELEAAEQQEGGLSAQEAGYAAQRAFGNTTFIKEDIRAMWGWGSIDRLAQDLSYALRLLRKSSAFTVTAVLSLGIGIGMNTAIFSLLDAVLLRDLPVRSPEELVVLAERSGSRESFSLSSPAFAALQENDTLAGLSAFRPWRVQTTTHGDPQFANSQLVSGDYFRLLGLGAFLGRTLTEQDDRVGANPVAVLSFGYWRREFNSDANAIGRTVDLQGHPFTIVGVTAPEFFGLEPGKQVDITVPLGMQPVVMPGVPLLKSPNAKWLRLVGRRKRGVPLAQAQADLDLRWARLLAASPRRRAAPNSHLELLPGAQGLYDLRRQFSLPLRALMAAVALVLLVACANLASLLLARATARRQEIGLRLSLGATRGRLLRQLLTETTLLSMMGGICGVALAYWVNPLLVAIMSRGRDPIMLDLAIHTRTLVFTALVSLITGLLFGIGPGLRATSQECLPGARLAGGQSRRWTAALIVSQVSLCLTVLVCAGLLLGSLRKLRQVDAGFRQDHVLLMSIRTGTSGYTGPRRAQLFADLYQRFSALPGVRSVTLLMDTPLGGVSYTAGASLPGSPRPESDAFQASVNTVGPRFFETMGIPLLRGRDLSAADDDRAPQVAVISESVALNLFSGRSALGERINIGQSSMQIVGVVKDTRYQSLREPGQPMVYRPYLQMRDPWPEIFAIRTAVDPEKITPFVRRELHEVAPDVPIFSLSTLEHRVDASLVQERTVSTLSAWFGGFALLLASIGLYGRLAYAVVERTREIGIRLALGAGRTTVMWTILREVMALVVCGLAIGLPLAIASARGIRSLLYGLEPFDPSTLSVVAVTILGVATLAGYIPALRASRVDPMVALRYE
jgi:macrolide transport system ATP-binding/permease protein